jgi:PAS domain S-box-containing protein
MCNGKGVYKRFKDSIPNTIVYRIKGGNKKVLFCTDISFSSYDGKKLSNYKIADAKGTKEVVDVWELNNGGYWLATNRGLTFLDRNFDKIHYTNREGLSSDNLYMVCFFNNALWTGGDRGIDKIIFNDDMEITSIKHFDKEEGFIGIECNAGALLLERNKMWIGTIKGVAIYQPEFDLPNKKKPKIHLLNIKLNYETINWKGLFPNLDVKENIPQGLTLTYDKNNLLFEFIAIDFVNPEKLKYQFKLEGFNKSWLPLTKESSVSYTNLPPGEYVFKVKAINSDGVWSEVYLYEFVIDVPFWKSTLFYFILFPSLLLIIYLFIVFRTRQLNRSKRKLEETVRQRTMEINKQKEELEKLSIVADKMNDGVVICQPDGKIDWINDGFKRMSGYNVDQFKETDVANIKYLQELSSHREISSIIKNFISNREPVIYDSTHATRDGSIMWTRAALTPIYSERNELLKIVALYTDITNHIRYEETLAQTNKDLTDSIVYAKKIQEAILPERKLMDQTFKEYFIYYNPRDIVSGDFYWFTKMNGMIILATADCTGHGVPGAFMSMIGNEFLHQIINNSGETHPDLILNQLNQRVTQALHQGGGDNDSKDGMDIAICTINLTTMFCRYAGAHIPMFIIRNGELIELEATRESIGGHNDLDKLFVLNELNLQKGDCIYFTTDGYVDQFGGNEGKKLMRKRWKELIKRYAHLPMKDQHAMLYELHHDWRGDKKQTDDILVIGIRID